MPGQPGLDEMSQLPSSAHQLLTNLTPITIDGQTVYIAQVRSDSNYALASVGNIASITPTSCPVSVGAPVQATQMNIQSSISNVMTIPNTGVTTSGGMFAMGLPGGNMTTTQKQVDSGARRHTSFASIWVYPVVDENINIEIIEKDLRIDTYRSSGAGGQHVNTTDSAVRITHLPSKIVVQCQNERSQHKNKETCMNMLKARLYDYEIKKKEQENQNTENSKSEIGWGHQIRSYVLQPYRLVKDNRTNFESTSPDKILDGDLDEFLEQSLYQIK